MKMELIICVYVVSVSWSIRKHSVSYTHLCNTLAFSEGLVLAPYWLQANVAHTGKIGFSNFLNSNTNGWIWRKGHGVKECTSLEHYLRVPWTRQRTKKWKICTTSRVLYHGAEVEWSTSQVHFLSCSSKYWISFGKSLNPPPPLLLVVISWQLSCHQCVNGP